MQSDRPIVSIVIASSNTGAACVEELLTNATYAGRVVTRAVFRSEEKAASLRTTHAAAIASGDLQIVSGVDAKDPASLPAAFDGVTATYIITPHDPAAGFADDADLTAVMVHAAVAAGVKHVVFGGSWTVNAAEALTILAPRFVGTEVSEKPRTPGLASV
jgi:uncharacterized protein YbjT (DUF2867 family)